MAKVDRDRLNRNLLIKGAVEDLRLPSATEMSIASRLHVWQKADHRVEAAFSTRPVPRRPGGRQPSSARRARGQTGFHFSATAMNSRRSAVAIAGAKLRDIFDRDSVG